MAGEKPQQLEQHLEQAKGRQFGFHEEEAIVSFAIDFPDMFTSVINFVEPSLFCRTECQYVVSWLLKLYKKYDVMPTRQLLRDQVMRHLTVDHPYEEVLQIVDRPSNPREVPIIRDTIKEWAESKQFGLLYSDDAIAAYHNRDYERLRQIFDGASRINDSGYKGMWFFDEYQTLLDPLNMIRYKTGFHRLDLALNDGGPGPGEVIIWLAATNVGKCHTLQSKIIEVNLSRIFVLEMDDGTSIELTGYREVQTQRGIIKVCDLSEGDDVVSVLDMEQTRSEDVLSL